MASSSNLRALVFGASGITGWAIAREALHYPTPTTFDQVIALTNRPLKKEEGMLPDDERLRMYSGINLSAGADEVEAGLKKIPGIEGVTHVYFSAYTGHGTGFDGIKKANVEILEHAIQAVVRLCPKLQFWTFQTGGKSYGFEMVGEIGLPSPPMQEALPRIPEPFASKIMYYAQYDVLSRLSAVKTWKFAEIRPDGISGFVPSNNAMNLAQTLALFFAFYAYREGKGASVPYPGPLAAYEARHSDVSQDILARFHLFTSLDPSTKSGEAYNIADESLGTSWAAKWPFLASYFGLTAAAPRPDEEVTFNIDEYMQSHKKDWAEWVEREGLKKGAIEGTDFGFLGVMLGMAIFGREYDLGKARNLGWEEERESLKGYLDAFEMMKAAHIIPQQSPDLVWNNKVR